MRQKLISLQACRVFFMETLIFQRLKLGRQLPVVQGVWVQMDSWITPRQTPSAAQQTHSAIISLRSPGLLSRKLLPEIWSPWNPWAVTRAEQSKADNCVWAYGGFRQTLEDLRGGCSSCPGISLGRLLGSTFIFVCCLGSLFCCSFCAETNNLWNQKAVEEQILPDKPKAPLWNLMDTPGLVWKLGNFSR